MKFTKHFEGTTGDILSDNINRFVKANGIENYRVQYQIVVTSDRYTVHHAIMIYEIKESEWDG